MRPFLMCCACLSMILPTLPVAAQEAATFGAWRAYCAPVAGCVMGVKSGQGDTLAFVESPSSDGQMLVFLAWSVPPDARISVSVDDAWSTALKPDTEWRTVETSVGQAIEVDSSVVENGLMEQMRRRASLKISYVINGGRGREVAFSLNGFADTLGYINEE